MEKSQSDAVETFSRYEKFVISILLFLQFTTVTDFMILNPLGPILMPALGIHPSQYGAIISVYSFGAGISGLLAAGFADFFDRKKMLLFFYTGFILGILFCALSSSFHFLLTARLITGLFAGVVGSVTLAIVADLFSFEVRGRVMALIGIAFSITHIMGTPLALYLGTRWNWHAPFWAIFGMSSLLGLLILIYFRPINAHIGLHKELSFIRHLKDTFKNPRHQLVFLAIALLETGSFMLFPFGTAYLVYNMNVSIEIVPIIFMVSGIVSIVSGRFVGRLSDSIGKFQTFALSIGFNILIVSIYTNMPAMPLIGVMLVDALRYIGFTSRIITTRALASSVPAQKYRGSFMSVTSSIQSLSGGFASLLAGTIIFERPDKTLGNIHVIGYIIIGAAILAVLLITIVHRTNPNSDNT